MRQVSKDKNFTIAFNLWPKLKEMGAIDNLFITGKINVRFHGRAQIFVDQLISFLKSKLEVNKDVTQRERTEYCDNLYQAQDKELSSFGQVNSLFLTKSYRQESNDKIYFTATIIQNKGSNWGNSKIIYLGNNIKNSGAVLNYAEITYKLKSIFMKWQDNIAKLPSKDILLSNIFIVSLFLSSLFIKAKSIILTSYISLTGNIISDLTS